MGYRNLKSNTRENVISEANTQKQEKQKYEIKKTVATLCCRELAGRQRGRANKGRGRRAQAWKVEAEQRACGVSVVSCFRPGTYSELTRLALIGGQSHSGNSSRERWRGK